MAVRRGEGNSWDRDRVGGGEGGCHGNSKTPMIDPSVDEHALRDLRFPVLIPHAI